MSSGTFKIAPPGYSKQVITIERAFFGLPDYKKLLVLEDLEAWIKKERVNINKKIPKA